VRRPPVLQRVGAVVAARRGDEGLPLAVQPYFKWSPEAVAKELRTVPSRGLSAAQVSRRMGRYGRNEVPDIPRRPRSAIMKEQVFTIPGMMLSAAAGFSALTGASTDAIFIAGALVANVVVGYLTEDYAERTIQSLRQVRTPHARVLRDGRRAKISISEVVPGDILLLEPGHVVAADGRVVRSEKLVMDESLLTGENVGQAKFPDTIERDDTPLAERCNMVYAGSAVASGKGAAIVTATAMRTELGQIRTLIGEAPDTPPPMSRELQRLGGTLALLSVGVCAVIGVTGILMGLPLVEVLTVTASLAVSAIPEGLPTVATTTLALGMKRMRAQNVVIRRLPAVAALGSATIICVDKTGTLTENRMSVRCFVLADVETEVAGALSTGGIRCIRRGQTVSPQDDPLLLAALQVGALCTEAELTRLPDGEWDAVGSSTEQALLLTAVYAGIDVPRIRAELELKELQERAAGRNYMVTMHQGMGGRSEILVKGAPEEVLALCSNERTTDGEVALTGRRQQQILQGNARLAVRGMRVLGLAQCHLEPGEHWNGPHGRLSWIGLVGMEDPVRGGAREAVEQLAKAGIRTLMLTGDQRITAEAVGRAVGLGEAGEVQVADASAIEECLASGHPLPDVLARISPADKFKIVQLLQNRGHVVMMTGDGVNDAPALKAADVGVAMGVRSTQIARDLADVILLDDNLQSLPIAISQGRTIFANIRKSLRFLLASNLSDIGLVAGALVLRLPLPLTALHLLWMNLVTDVFPAIALSMEPSEPGVMDEPPRPSKEPLLTRSLWRIISREAAIIAAATFGSYLWAVVKYGAGARARTVAFTTITMAELAYAISCRTEKPGLAGASGRKNSYLWACLSISALAQVAAVTFPPFRLLLGTTPLGLADWLTVALGSGAALAATEGLKLLPATSSRALVAPASTRALAPSVVLAG
ncbi:MAG: cation-transporting P-type ATPase, partial [Armatimonadota bacterium]|nr:cation-transporting P-type ATPase [Armatimonadota bacterium]